MPERMEIVMHGLDVSIVVIYLAGLVWLGWKLGRNNKSQKDYFIGGRSVATLPIALSIAATTVSANGFIGGPGWGYESGLIAFMLNYSIPLVMIVTLSVFLPFFYNLDVTSIYEYIELRLGGWSRMLAVIGFTASNLIQVGSFLFIPSLIITTFTGWSLFAVVPLVVLISIVYTLLGGIKAVIWTDAVQMVVLWGGLAVSFFIILSELQLDFMEAYHTAEAAGKLDSLDFSLDFKLENGGWAALIGGGFLWLKYYAADQTQTQRMFAAKSIQEVKKSLCLSGVIMNVTYFAFMIIGVLLFISFDGQSFRNSNEVMIEFIAGQIPVGILGLIIAGVFAAAMSSIDSVLNSVTTVFVKDVYEKFFTREEAGLKVSMTFTVVFGLLLIGFTLLAFAGTTASILEVVGSYLSYFSGPMLAMFFLGMFTTRGHDYGAASGFIVGIVITTWSASLDIVNWLWNYPIGFISSFAVGYVISCFLPPSSKTRYTVAGQIRALKRENHVEDEGGYSILPGTFDRYSWFLLGFFVLQNAVLLFLQFL